jgi:short-subunit dehydrogenase
VKTYRLDDSTIVITGASSGIGKATALAFAKLGANLILAARSETLLQQLASECEALGANAIAVPTDVTERSSVEHLYQTALTFYGAIDVWINNAGVGALGEFDKTPLEAQEQVIRTNLMGPFYGSYFVMPHFKKRRKGIIINTNSTGAFIGAPFSVSYSASKFGLRGLSEALRYEVQDLKDIHICDIFASFVDSPGFRHSANYLGKEAKPAPPLIDPDKVAETMVKLVQRPRSSIHLGSTDFIGRFGHMILPGLTGKIMNKFEREYFKKAKEVPRTEGNLFEPDYDETSSHGGFS